MRWRQKQKPHEAQPGPGLVLAPAGPREVVCAAAAQVLIWSLDTQEVQLCLKADDLEEQRCSVGATSDGQMIAAGLVGKHPVVLVWDRADPGMPVARLKAHRFDITSLTFDAQGMRLATAGNAADGQICIWDCNTWTLLSRHHRQSDVRSLAFVGHALISVGQAHVKVWTLQEGGVAGVRMSAGAPGGMSISTKALPLNEQKSSTILAIATDESGRSTNGSVYLLTDSGAILLVRSSWRSIDRVVDSEVADAASLAVSPTMLACCGTMEASLFANGTLMQLAVIALGPRSAQLCSWPSCAFLGHDHLVTGHLSTKLTIWDVSTPSEARLSHEVAIDGMDPQITQGERSAQKPESSKRRLLSWRKAKPHQQPAAAEGLQRSSSFTAGGLSAGRSSASFSHRSLSMSANSTQAGIVPRQDSGTGERMLPSALLPAWARSKQQTAVTPTSKEITSYDLGLVDRSASQTGSAAERYAGISSSDSSQDVEGPAEAGLACQDDEATANTCGSREMPNAELAAKEPASTERSPHRQDASAPGFLARISPNAQGVAMSLAVPSPSRLGRPPLQIAKSLDERSLPLQPIKEADEGRGTLREALTGMQAELDALSSTWSSLKDPWPARRAAAMGKGHDRQLPDPGQLDTPNQAMLPMPAAASAAEVHRAVADGGPALLEGHPDEYLEQESWDQPAWASWHQNQLGVQQAGVREVSKQTEGPCDEQQQQSCPPSTLGSGPSTVPSAGGQPKALNFDVSPMSVMSTPEIMRPMARHPIYGLLDSGSLSSSSSRSTCLRPALHGNPAFDSSGSRGLIATAACKALAQNPTFGLDVNRSPQQPTLQMRRMSIAWKENHAAPEQLPKALPTSPAPSGPSPMGHSPQNPWDRSPNASRGAGPENSASFGDWHSRMGSPPSHTMQSHLLLHNAAPHHGGNSRPASLPSSPTFPMPRSLPHSPKFPTAGFHAPSPAHSAVGSCSPKSHPSSGSDGSPMLQSNGDQLGRVSLAEHGEEVCMSGNRMQRPELPAWSASEQGMLLRVSKPQNMPPGQPDSGSDGGSRQEDADRQQNTRHHQECAGDPATTPAEQEEQATSTVISNRVNHASNVCGKAIAVSVNSHHQAAEQEAAHFNDSSHQQLSRDSHSARCQPAELSKPCEMDRTSGVLELDNARQAASHWPPEISLEPATAARQAALASAASAAVLQAEGMAVQTDISKLDDEPEASDGSANLAAAAPEQQPSARAISATGSRHSPMALGHHNADDCKESSPRALREHHPAPENSMRPMRHSGASEGQRAAFAAVQRQEHVPADEYMERPLRPEDACEGPTKVALTEFHKQEEDISPTRPGQSPRASRQDHPAPKYMENTVRSANALERPAGAALADAQEVEEKEVSPGRLVQSSRAFTEDHPAAEVPDTPGEHREALGPATAALAESQKQMLEVNPARPGQCQRGLNDNHPAVEYSESPLRPGDALEGPARAALAEVQRQKEERQRAAAALWKQMQDLSLQTNAMLLGAMHPSPPRPRPPHPRHPPATPEVEDTEGPLPTNAPPDVPSGSSNSSLACRAKPQPSVVHQELIAPEQSAPVWQPEGLTECIDAESARHVALENAVSSEAPETADGSSSLDGGCRQGPSAAAQTAVAPSLGAQPAPWPLPESSTAVVRQAAVQPQPSVRRSGVQNGPGNSLRASQRAASVLLGDRKASGEGSSQGSGPRGKENRARFSNGMAPPANAANGPAKPSTRMEPMRASMSRAARTSLTGAQLTCQVQRSASTGQGNTSGSKEGPTRRGAGSSKGPSAERAPAARPQTTWGRPSSAPSQQNGTTGPQDFLRRSTQSMQGLRQSWNLGATRPRTSPAAAQPKKRTSSMHASTACEIQRGTLASKEQPQKVKATQKSQAGWKIGASKAPLPSCTTRRRSQAGAAPAVPSTPRQALAAEVEQRSGNDSASLPMLKATCHASMQQLAAASAQACRLLISCRDRPPSPDAPNGNADFIAVCRALEVAMQQTASHLTAAVVSHHSCQVATFYPGHEPLCKAQKAWPS
ncbi:hypothetical protein WJX74_005344 [Apatococcus lobatus]|uniref:Uncharacterized protein n=1 Tax=Apatococcus lobatus TaxID=904363 RepID=A0AAW1RSH7_9CHLO